MTIWKTDILESSVNNQTTGCICEEVSLGSLSSGLVMYYACKYYKQSITHKFSVVCSAIMITERIITYGNDIAKSTKLRCILNIAVNNLAVAIDSVQICISKTM